MASGDLGRSVTIWYISSGINTRNLSHNAPVFYSAFSPEIETGLSIASGSLEPSDIIWNGTYGDSSIRDFQTYNSVYYVVLNADGSLLAAVAINYIPIIDPRNGKFY